MVHRMTQDSTLVGTVGGTIISVSAIPSTASIISTIILAAIGAVASFLFSIAAKYLWNKYVVKVKPEPKKKDGR